MGSLSSDGLLELKKVTLSCVFEIVSLSSGFNANYLHLLCILLSGTRIASRVYQDTFRKSDKTEGRNQQDAKTFAKKCKYFFAAGERHKKKHFVFLM